MLIMNGKCLSVTLLAGVLDRFSQCDFDVGH